MRFRTALPILLVACTASGAEGQQTPVFRASTTLVNLTVTVTDRKHRPSQGLAPDDFRIYEDGFPQDIALFEPQRLPLDLVFILDTSTSTRGNREKVRLAAGQLVDRMRPGDEAEVLVFARGTYRVCDFTGDTAAVRSALSEVSPEDEKSHIHRAILTALDDLKRRPAGERHQVIVILTDGDDNDPLADEDWLTLQVSRSAATFYVVYAPPATIGADQVFQASRDRALLERLTRQSGGFLVELATPYELTLRFGRIAEELRSQYRIGYAPSPDRPAGKWRYLQVVVRKPGLLIRHRERYWASKNE